MPEEPRLNRKHVHQTKVLLNEEFDRWLESAARIHGTPKAVMAREILKSWLLETVGDFKRDSHVG